MFTEAFWHEQPMQEATIREAAASLAGVFVFFPDPWPKKRHHKCRLMGPEFVAMLRRKLCLHARGHRIRDSYRSLRKGLPGEFHLRLAVFK